MFGADLYKKNEEAIKEKTAEEDAKKIEADKKRLEKAKQKMEEIKEKLEARLNSGEPLMIDLGMSYFSSDVSYQKAREVGWTEGINICRRNNDRGKIYYAIINNFFKNIGMDSFVKYNKPLKNYESNYIEFEKEYFDKITGMQYVKDECAYIELSLYSVEKKKILILALLNAAYRKGLEGNIESKRTRGETQKIRPTYVEVISLENIDLDYYENYIQIMHNYHIEQADKKNQKEYKPPQKAKNTKTG